MSTSSVAIDVGMTSFRAAYVDEGRGPAVLRESSDQVRSWRPATTLLAGDVALVGAPPSTSLARLVGGELRFAFSADMPPVDSEPDAVPVREPDVETLAVLLKYAYETGRSRLGRPADAVTLVVPDNISRPERALLSQAAAIAGLPSIGFVRHAEAVARHYGWDSRAVMRPLMIARFGGASGSISILAPGSQGWQLLASRESARLGGNSMDRNLAELLRGHYRAAFETSLPDRDEEQLLKEAETLKLRMTDEQRSAFVAVPLGGRVLAAAMSAAQLTDAAQSVVAAALDLATSVLQNAALEWRDLEAVLLAGGGAALPPLVRGLTAQASQAGVRLSVKQPHLAAVFGAAALPAAGEPTSVNGHSGQPSPLKIGLRVACPTSGQRIEWLLDQAKSRPAVGTRRITVQRPQQSRLIFDVVAAGTNEQPRRLEWVDWPVSGGDQPQEFEVRLEADGRHTLQFSVKPLGTGETLERTIALSDPDNDQARQRQRVATLKIVECP